MLDGTELDAAPAGQFPQRHGRLGKPPVIAVNLKAAVDNAFELRIFPAKDDAALVAACCTKNQVRLTTACRTAIEKEISGAS